MLQKLNERIQGVVAWIVVILIAVTFTLFGIDYYMQSRHDSTAKVDVNGQPITKQAFDLSYRRAYQSLSPSDMTLARENQLKQQLLNEMILNSVSVQSARQHGFEVSPTLAESAIVSIPQFQEDGHFSVDRYSQALNNAFFTPDSFQKEVRQGMLLNQQRFAMIGTSFALTRDIAQFVKLALQTRDYDYLKIQIRPISDTSTVSADEIKAYYQRHRATFVTPERVSVDYIRLSINDIKKTINVSDASIKRYYEDNKLDSKKSFEDLKSDIKEQLLSERAQAKYAKKLEQLTDLSYQTPDTLTPVSEALMLPIEHSELFSRLGGEGTLLKNKQVVRTSFSHDVLELGNNSEPIQMDNDTVIVLRINQHMPISEKPLAEVHEMIVKKLASIKATEKAAMLGKKLLDAALTLADKEKLIQDNKLHWEHVKRATRDTDAVLAPINEAAFGLPSINALTGVSLEDGSYVLVRLTALHDGDLALLDKEQVSSITQQIESNYGMLDYELYVNELMSKARVVRY